MKLYRVVEANKDHVTIWDGLSYDPDHPGQKAGLMTFWMKDHEFCVGDKVSLVLRLEERTEKC